MGEPHKRQVPSDTCAARPRDSSIAFRTTANGRGLGCASPSFVGILLSLHDSARGAVRQVFGAPQITSAVLAIACSPRSTTYCRHTNRRLLRLRRSRERPDSSATLEAHTVDTDVAQQSGWRHQRWQDLTCSGARSRRANTPYRFTTMTPCFSTAGRVHCRRSAEGRRRHRHCHTPARPESEIASAVARHRSQRGRVSRSIHRA